MTEKIVQLTEDQLSKAPMYAKKGLEIGLNTSPCNRKLAESLIADMYKEVGLEPPSEIIWARSPYEAIDLLTAKFDISKQECYDAFCFGHHDSSWLGFYSYFNHEVGIEECKKLEALENFSMQVGWFAPFKEVICICERPLELNFISNGQMVSIRDEKPKSIYEKTPIIMHGDGKPSITFRDGKLLYHLNGVLVSKYLAMTPARDIDCNMLLKEKNAEVRREFVRKVGIERVIEQLGAEIIDKQDNYELLLLDIGNGQMRPYLKMTNPSIGVYHVEGVPPETKTVEEALTFRNGTTLKPSELT